MPAGNITELYANSFKERGEVIIDFGEHLTGYFSFHTYVTQYTADAPLRFKLTFGEVPSELATPFNPYPGGLSRAWLQGEIVTVMQLPATITIPRRVSFRYVKIEVLASSSYDFNISSLTCKAVTSAATTPEPLLATTPQLFQEIDRISLNTLKECMQTVYEDGPKRDQRLWMGDLYLEALANNFSFKQHDLAKRCLYLLAGCAEEDGLLNGTLFETPEPHPQARQLLIDYSYLFGVALKDYLLATGDKDTAHDLWPVVLRQLETTVAYQQENGLLDYTKAASEWWVFFDWKDGLHKEVALHEITLFTMQECYELAKLLGKEKEVSHLSGRIKALKMQPGSIITIKAPACSKIFLTTRSPMHPRSGWYWEVCLTKLKPSGHSKQ